MNTQSDMKKIINITNLNH